MKTTLDIPDDIFRKVKARAALRGVSLRQFVTEAVRDKVESESSLGGCRTEPPWMRGFGALADLKQENRAVEKKITEACETVDAEDRA